MNRLLLKEYTNGKKYLCKTTREDWETYLGSGNDVKSNPDLVLKKTTLLGEYETNEELREYGIYYSELWDVVNDPMFLNQTREEGQGGYTSYTEERNKKISDSLKGRERTQEHSNNISKSKSGMVTVRNITTNETCTVSLEEFENNPNLIGINKGMSWVQNTPNGHGNRGKWEGNGKHLLGREPANSKAIIAEGKEFSSIKKAEDFYNRSRGWIQRRLDDPTNDNFKYKE